MSYVICQLNEELSACRKSVQLSTETDEKLRGDIKRLTTELENTRLQVIVNSMYRSTLILTP